ncbi:MAG: TRAM domain-containing protein, partial [Lachnospiraceae bacterium]|nr:TRAM domain-containing protein [Lachnospiraceae bacterium]
VRNGTPAATMPDQIPEDVAHERFDRLLTLVQKRGQEMSSRFEGQTLPVLVEEKNRTPGMVTGRTSHNLTVHFEGDESLIGKIVPVYLAESRGFYYFGKMR